MSTSKTPSDQIWQASSKSIEKSIQQAIFIQFPLHQDSK